MHNLPVHADTEPARPNPKVFISYSWESDLHRRWVMEFATRLRRDGVDVSFGYGSSYTQSLLTRADDVHTFSMRTFSPRPTLPARVLRSTAEMNLPRTFVSFRSNDISRYHMMCAWKANEHIDFTRFRF